jgi:hypothetical protein
MKTTKLSNGIALYAASMGKLFRVTHICLDGAQANQAMSQDNSIALIAEDRNGLCYLAKTYGNVAPSAILDDLKQDRPTLANVKPVCSDMSEDDGKRISIHTPGGLNAEATKLVGARIAELERQKSALLAALELALGYVECDELKGVPFMLSSMLAADEIRAAIKSAKGGNL